MEKVTKTSSRAGFTNLFIYNYFNNKQIDYITSYLNSE